MDIEKEMMIGEAEARVMAQRHARQVAKNELLRLSKRTQELTESVQMLGVEIDKSEAALATLKTG